MPNFTSALACLALLAAIFAGPAAADPPKPLSAKDFANAAAQSDQFEILEARTVLAQSRDPQVRAFAQQMIQDHTRTSASLNQAVTRSGLTPPPPSLGDDQAKMLGSLQSETSPDFDRTYARQQMLAHAQALVVEQTYASGGSDPSLQQVARSAVPMIRQHLATAQRMQAALGKP